MFWPSQRFWHFTSAAQIVKIQEKIGNSWIFDIISNFYVKLNFCFWYHQVRQSRQYKYLLRFSWVCFENKPKHIAPLHWHWKDKQTNRIRTSQFHEFFLKNFFFESQTWRDHLAFQWFWLWQSLRPFWECFNLDLTPVSPMRLK